MNDVVLFTDNTDNFQISIGLGPFKLASVLRKNGYNTLVVNQLSWFTFDEIIQIIDKAVTKETKALGFSTTYFQSVDLDENGDRNLGYMWGTKTLFPQGKDFEDQVLAYVKTINPDIKIIAGGVKTDYTAHNPNLDYVFLGYSETSIIDFMKHLDSATPLPNSSVNEHGIVIVDDRTAPHYKFTEDMMIWKDTDIVNHKVLPIEIGRGCIFKCKFCSYPLIGKKALDYNKNVDLIYDELLQLYENFGITHYMIVDDTFNDHISKLTNLEQAIKRLPFQPLFWCYARLDLLCTNPSMIDVMYNIGVRGVFFGIETLNQETGRHIGKGYDRQKQIDMVRYIREKYPDISMTGAFIVGLPHESVESIKLTTSQLVSGEIPLHSFIMMTLHLFDESFSAFSSDLNTNYHKYGYEIISNVGGILIWKNEHMDMNTAKRLADEAMLQGREVSDHSYLASPTCFELVNFGYDLHESMNTKWKDFSMPELKTRVNSFIENYKSTLLQMLSK